MSLASGGVAVSSERWPTGMKCRCVASREAFQITEVVSTKGSRS